MAYSSKMFFYVLAHKFRNISVEVIAGKKQNLLKKSVSHIEEIWGQRFQLWVWTIFLNTNKMLLICII